MCSFSQMRSSVGRFHLTLYNDKIYRFYSINPLMKPERGLYEFSLRRTSLFRIYVFMCKSVCTSNRGRCITPSSLGPLCRSQGKMHPTDSSWQYSIIFGYNVYISVIYFCPDNLNCMKQNRKHFLLIQSGRLNLTGTLALVQFYSRDVCNIVSCNTSITNIQYGNSESATSVFTAMLCA